MEFINKEAKIVHYWDDKLKKNVILSKTVQYTPEELERLALCKNKVGANLHFLEMNDNVVTCEGRDEGRVDCNYQQVKMDENNVRDYKLERDEREEKLRMDELDRKMNEPQEDIVVEENPTMPLKLNAMEKKILAGRKLISCACGGHFMLKNMKAHSTSKKHTLHLKNL